MGQRNIRRYLYIDTHFDAPSKQPFLNAKMNESAYYFRHEFDYQTDFTQFLEEAREHVFQVNSDSIPVEEKQLDWKKKSRKPWKSYLFSWLKNDKKSKTVKARPGHVSGPLERAVAGKAQRAVSGPLTGLFGLTGKSEEDEMPYMCLGQLHKQRLHSYGPVYLVT